MEKLRFPLKPRGVEGAKGVSINFRPQACSPPWRRLGSEVEGSLQSTHWDSLLGRPGLGQNARVPAPSPQGPLLSLGRLGAGFVYSLHAPRARPIRGERRLYVTHPSGQPALIVLLRRQSSRGGSGAVAGPGKGGRSRQRSCLRLPPLLRTRGAPCLFFGQARGRAHGWRPGASNSRVWAGQAADLTLLPRVRAGRDPAAAKHRRPRLGRTALRGCLVLCSRAAVRSGALARASVPRASRPGPACSWADFPPSASRPPCHPESYVYSHAFSQALPSNP